MSVTEIVLGTVALLVIGPLLVVWWAFMIRWIIRTGKNKKEL